MDNILSKIVNDLKFYKVLISKEDYDTHNKLQDAISTLESIQLLSDNEINKK